MVTHTFKLENYERWLEDLATKLNTPLKDHLLVLPSHLGKGTIMAHAMSNQLSYAVMNFKLETDLEFYREAGGVTGLSLSFNQVDTQKEIQISPDQKIIADKKPLRNDIYLSDTREPLHLRFPAGSTVKRVMIFATHELAAKYIPADLLEKLEAFARENSISDNPYFVSLPHRETLKELFEMKEYDPLSQIRRLGRIIHLTEKFLHSFLRQEQATMPRSIKKGDLEHMQHIEQILSSKLEGFPSLESLAHEVFMSTSKLKNLFKQVYGYTLYDYYNKSRLQRAKEMLITGQCSVKQAGSEIGFSNLSHFAKAFKKEFGILPRDLVKNK